MSLVRHTWLTFYEAPLGSAWKGRSLKHGSEAAPRYKIKIGRARARAFHAEANTKKKRMVEKADPDSTRA